MNRTFLILSIILMLARLPYIYRGTKIRAWYIPIFTLGQIILGLIILSINQATIYFLITTIIIFVFSMIWEFKSTNRLIGRAISLFLHIISFSIFTSPNLQLELSTYTNNICTSFIANNTSFGESILLQYEGLVITFGLLFLLTETNLIIQLITKSIKDQNQSNQKDKKEKLIVNSWKKFENTDFVQIGRAIGIIERVIIYLSILIGQPTIAGFVITAKGIFRFKGFDSNNQDPTSTNKESLELMLLGTLLSVLFAMIISSIVVSLIKEYLTIIF